MDVPRGDNAVRRSLLSIVASNHWLVLAVESIDHAGALVLDCARSKQPISSIYFRRHVVALA